MSKSRGWCFTINNYTVLDDFELEGLKDEATLQYLVYGREVGTQNTPHYQGFMRFKHPITLRRAKQFVSRAHLEPQRGTAQEAAQYCKKDGDYEEFGELPKSGGQQTKDKWKAIIQLAEVGDLNTIKEEYPGTYVLHYNKLLSLRRREPSILSELINEWWVGPTGTGKSRRLWHEYPDHYQKSLNKWWDGYDNEEVVAIEEMTPDAGKYLSSFIKIWCDRYPFSPEIKGSTIKKIRPRKIIILSNYTPEECFEREQDLLPIKRRFKIVQFATL